MYVSVESEEATTLWKFAAAEIYQILNDVRDSAMEEVQVHVHTCIHVQCTYVYVYV